MHACKNVDVPAVDDCGSMDNSGSMAVDGYGSMAENEDNEAMQVGTPVQRHSSGDVNPEPATPRGTQRHPDAPRGTQPQTEPDAPRNISQNQPETPRNIS